MRIPNFYAKQNGIYEYAPKTTKARKHEDTKARKQDSTTERNGGNKNTFRC